MISLATALLALWLAFASPLALASDTPDASANTMCPVMTDEPIDPDLSLLHEGKTIYFCCAKCRRNFEAKPAEYLAHLPQFGGTPPIAAPVADAPTLTQPKPVEPMQRLGRFHVVTVHFPIALLILAALVELFRPRKDDHPAEFTVRLLAWAGAASALLAMTLGLIHEEAVESTLSGTALETLELHEWTGIAVAVAATLAAIALQARAAQPTTVVAKLAAPLLYIIAVAIAFNAHLGGTLVYGRGFLLPW